jgi:multiple sugar transport system permease protein
MTRSRASILLRDVVAVTVVAVFMFPLFWWALTSIKPDYAIFDKDGINWFDFEPTFDNYRVTVFGQSRLSEAEAQGIAVGSAGAGSYDSRQSLIDSIIIALGATLVSVGVAVFAAYALSRMAFRGRVGYLNWVLGQRFMPPIALVVPLVLIYRDFGMRDVNSLFLGYLGLILIYALMNLPIACC